VVDIGRKHGGDGFEAVVAYRRVSIASRLKLRAQEVLPIRLVSKLDHFMHLASK